jgi:hypothetical protein
MKGFFFFATASRPALDPPSFLPNGYRWLFLSLGIKRPDVKLVTPPLSSAELKNAWSYTSTPPYVFMARYLIKQGDKFTFIKGKM